jgi:hypothetical protein
MKADRESERFDFVPPDQGRAPEEELPRKNS